MSSAPTTTPPKPRRLRTQSQRGSALVEFSIAILPLFGLLLLTIDVAWSIFARATLQHAVREGVRFGVTGQISAGNTCLGASIQQAVAQNSFGFVPANQAANLVKVTYYTPSTLTQVTGAGSTIGGNVVQVSVAGVLVHSFGPLLHALSPISLSATASDVLESPANGVPPCP